MPTPLVDTLGTCVPWHLQTALAGGWSIGIAEGATPVDLHTLPAGVNPVLTRHHVTDVAASFVADPFIVRLDRSWYMFFEIGARGKGIIGLATSDDGRSWTYQKVVLEEPFHLSYPYVFSWDGEHYMIPEAGETRSVRVYRATEFPHSWHHHATVLRGQPYVDSSIVRHRDRWWMFTQTDSRNHSLRLFHATELEGHWIEHPRSPIVHNNPAIARPAGRIVTHDHTMYRFAQDCSRRYGWQVRAFRILELSPHAYDEEELASSPVLQPANDHWNSACTHHVDPRATSTGEWIAAIDGR